MSEWNEGYFTESTYTFGYYRELSPVYQRFCLLAKGFSAQEPTAESVHCELGYGQGVSANIHAAAVPGKFFGTDFNPAHAAGANELLQASGANANFFDDSFEQMLERDLPQFDSISLHGIWTWISRENQQHIVDFAKKFLKQGGIFYNSYNCYPGWAAKAPMRELFVLHDKFAHQSADTFKRVEEALKFTEQLLNANPIYALQVPLVKSAFEQVKNLNHDYLAHEYFNRDWICMYFTEVLEILEAAKLEFACSANLVDLYDELNLTEQAREFLATIDNPTMREQARDYFINQQFRKDYFVRGVRKISAAERTQILRDTRYILMTAGEVSLKVASMAGEVTLSEQIAKPLIEFLRAENFAPKTLADFLAAHEDLNQNSVEQILLLLIYANAVAPCQSVAAENAVAERSAKLNKFICKRSLVADEVSTLASPVIGGGINFSRFDRMFMHFFGEGLKTADELAQKVFDTLAAQGQRLVMNDKRLDTPEENVAEFKKMAENFLQNYLPSLRALRII